MSTKVKIICWVATTLAVGASAILYTLDISKIPLHAFIVLIFVVGFMGLTRLAFDNIVGYMSSHIDESINMEDYKNEYNDNRLRHDRASNKKWF